MKMLWLLLPLAIIWLTSWIYFGLLPVGWWIVPSAATMVITIFAALGYAIERITRP